MCAIVSKYGSRWPYFLAYSLTCLRCLCVVALLNAYSFIYSVKLSIITSIISHRKMMWRAVHNSLHLLDPLFFCWYNGLGFAVILPVIVFTWFAYITFLNDLLYMPYYLIRCKILSEHVDGPVSILTVDFRDELAAECTWIYVPSALLFAA